jgi:hypothetical protein
LERLRLKEYGINGRLHRVGVDISADSAHSGVGKCIPNNNCMR